MDSGIYSYVLLHQEYIHVLCTVVHHWFLYPFFCWFISPGRQNIDEMSHSLFVQCSRHKALKFNHKVLVFWLMNKDMSNC